MKKMMMTFLAILPFIALSSNGSNLYDQKVKSANGENISFNDFKGKSVLVINIATKCGYTGQLDGLESLYKKYKDKGLAVIGVPSNDFASQTPENDKEVANFCRLKYGVSFPITTKLPVLGDEKHAFAKFLVESSGGKEIGWNFEKFLFDKNGKFISRFSSSVTPESKDLIQAIDNSLK